MLARSATVLLFTLLTQPSWSERTGCFDVVTQRLTNVARNCIGTPRSDGYINEFVYNDYGHNTNINSIPSTVVVQGGANGISLLVGEFYEEPNVKIIGNDNSKSVCSNPKIIKEVNEDYIPKVRPFSGPGKTPGQMYTHLEIGERFTVETTVWSCSNVGNRMEDEETIEFLRIVNILKNKKMITITNYGTAPKPLLIEKIIRLDGVSVKTEKKNVVAEITEIKYLDEKTKEPVKYLGKVKLVGEETQTP